MDRRLAAPIAALVMAPAGLFWSSAIALSVGARLGLTDTALGPMLGGWWPALNPHSGAFKPAASAALLAVVFAGPVLALMVLAASLVEASVSVEGGRFRVNLQTRWLGGLDAALLATLTALGACSALWLIPHAFLGS